LWQVLGDAFVRLQHVPKKIFGFFD